ncbi:MAG: hypothetical protein ACRYG2_16105 [Janthinobacterium lividum]
MTPAHLPTPACPEVPKQGASIERTTMTDDTNTPDFDERDELDERDVLRALDPDLPDVPVLDILYNNRMVLVDGEPTTWVAAPPVWYGDARRAREQLDETGSDQ